MFQGLWDALFLTACERWTTDKMSNITFADAWELGSYFHRGQQNSKRPLFEGLCAMCGCLLYAGARSMSNICYGLHAHAQPSYTPGETAPLLFQCACRIYSVRGPPLNRDGEVLVEAGGPRTNAQPPCLLRFSPQMWAKECPTMFAHDEDTNTLRLQPGRQPPWIRKTSEQEGDASRDSTKTWCYCHECKGRWCPDAAQRSRAFLPFRDRASQLNMRPQATPQATEACDVTSVQPQPELEGEGADAFPGDVEIPDDMQEEEAEPVVLPTEHPVPAPPDPNAFPTLDEYRARWEARLAAHARPTGEEYSLSNLVPKPVPNLWQDCPMAPFDQLKSEEAQSGLCACRPVSAFTASTLKEGMPRYSHITGDVFFRRRSMRTPSCCCKRCVLLFHVCADAPSPCVEDPGQHDGLHTEQRRDRWRDEEHEAR